MVVVNIALKIPSKERKIYKSQKNLKNERGYLFRENGALHDVANGSNERTPQKCR